MSCWLCFSLLAANFKCIRLSHCLNNYSKCSIIIRNFMYYISRKYILRQLCTAHVWKIFGNFLLHFSATTLWSGVHGKSVKLFVWKIQKKIEKNEIWERTTISPGLRVHRGLAGVYLIQLSCWAENRAHFWSIWLRRYAHFSVLMNEYKRVNIKWCAA